MKKYIFKKVINLITFNLFYTQDDLVCILALILPETIIPDSHKYEIPQVRRTLRKRPYYVDETD